MDYFRVALVGNPSRGREGRDGRGGVDGSGALLGEEGAEKGEGAEREVVVDVAGDHGGPEDGVAAWGLVEGGAGVAGLAAAGVHVNEGGGDEEVWEEAEAEGEEVELAPGAEGGDSGGGVEGGGEGGAVGAEAEAEHGGERGESGGGIAGAGEVGDGRVP